MHCIFDFKERLKVSIFKCLLFRLHCLQTLLSKPRFRAVGRHLPALTQQHSLMNDVRARATATSILYYLQDSKKLACQLCRFHSLSN